jgi:hypothetical protein
MARPFSTNGEKRNAYRILVETPEGKRPLRRRRWDLGETGWNGMYWIDLTEGMDQWRVLMNTNEHSGSIKC